MKSKITSIDLIDLCYLIADIRAIDISTCSHAQFVFSLLEVVESDLGSSREHRLKKKKKKCAQNKLVLKLSI